MRGIRDRSRSRSAAVQFRLPLVALLVVVVCSALQLVIADGCYDCCREGRNCDEAFDGSRGTCCGRISDTYYCCPLSDVCAQNARDAICVVPGTNNVRTYAYAYTPGSSFASWIIAPIVIGAVCCCAIAGLMAWRRRKVQREMMMNGGGMAPVTVVGGDSYGNYQRRYSNDAQPHLAPHSLPMATYAQPPPGGSRVPTGVPQSYQDSGVYAGAPNRFTNSGAPVALPIATPVVDSSLPQARDDAGLRGEGQPRPYGNAY